MEDNKQNKNWIIKVVLLGLLVVNVHLFLIKPKLSVDTEAKAAPVATIKGRSFMEKQTSDSAEASPVVSSFVGEKFSRSSIEKAIYSTNVTSESIRMMPQMVSDPAQLIKTGSKISLKVTSDGYIEVPFALLQAYTYEGKNVFPKAIQQLHNQKVSVVGFTMPIEVNDDRKVISSLLIKDPPGCCFSDSPKLNDWLMLEVDPAIAEVPLWASSPFKVFGTFTAGEVHEGGEVISIYQIKTEKVEKFKVTKRWW